MKNRQFIKDVVVCSLGSYGGPEAHFGVFNDQLVTKRNYLSEEEFIELIALSKVLPGPSSTQTLTAIAYRVGGLALVLQTLLVWIVPAVLMMIGISFLSANLLPLSTVNKALRFIGPVALGFIVLALYRMSQKTIVDTFSLFLLVFGTLATYFIKEIWIYPVVIVVGGLLALLKTKRQELKLAMDLEIEWRYLLIFLGLFVLSILFKAWSQNPFLNLFETFYRYGTLVIGGGQVVIPMMYQEFVEVTQILSHQDFMNGYGLVQGLPGPMFSFSAYLGAMATSDLGSLKQIIGGLVSGLTIFIPGTLLILFVYPLWLKVRTFSYLQAALMGIMPVATGMILSSAITMAIENTLSLPMLVITFASAISLASKKIPAPLLILITILFGISLPV
ncbi:chromate efflux transporter [Erysipelothrix urinaevulpis]|uniref:chromate efflux transporter n=1 Tax=Erysipelothrix urinaevulpis TaxID=2683717 RepID=UPI0013588053|nr:chromate efflux transporter [Erysipelothrix urinaevulpis]